MNLAAYPIFNGWTADENTFYAGLPGSFAHIGDFDPLGFTADLPVQEIKYFRDADIIHGWVLMLVTIRYLVAEKSHPLFGSEFMVPASSHLAQVQYFSPFFFAILVSGIDVAEFGRARTG